MAEKAIKTVGKESKVVLLTHAPPYVTKMDVVPGFGHVGNKDYRTFIEKHKNVVLAFCGHIHEAEGTEELIGSTRVINVSKSGRVIEL